MAERRFRHDVAYQLLGASFINAFDFQIAGGAIQGSTAPNHSASAGFDDSLLKSVT